jgi:ketosteroid isomerase-like protein
MERFPQTPGPASAVAQAGEQHLGLARLLYQALRDADGPALARLLHPDFVGRVTAGLPNGYGGEYHGAKAMLLDVWARVWADYDMAPRPDQLLVAEDGTVVAVGRYLGSARATGRSVDAAFAHILRFRDGKLVELHQITDSQRWVEALEPAPSPSTP